MIRKTILFSLLTVFVLGFTACETDVDINADWEEITLVYGLLDQADQTHYFRINKAFLGGNALEIAKIADSSSYMGALEVNLQGIDMNGQIVQTIPMDTTTIATKDSGFFYNPYMLVYKGTGTLNSQYQYKLNIRNTISGKEITATTRLIDEFTISKPPSGGKASFKRDFTTPFEWRNADNAMRYEPKIRFHYFEVHAGDTLAKYIDWSLPTQFAENYGGQNGPEMDVSNNGFYDFIANNIKPQQIEGHRLCGLVDFIVTAAGEEYDTYMRVNGPSNSLVQDRPEYTNIENGFGLLSSRYTTVKARRLSPIEAEAEILLLERDFVVNPNL